VPLLLPQIQHLQLHPHLPVRVTQFIFLLTVQLVVTWALAVTQPQAMHLAMLDQVFCGLWNGVEVRQVGKDLERRMKVLNLGRNGTMDLRLWKLDILLMVCLLMLRLSRLTNSLASVLPDQLTLVVMDSSVNLRPSACILGH